jgi:hypothetical protein
MARGAKAVKDIAEVSDLLVASVDRVFRTLQGPKDDHAPLGKFGGGKDTPHMEIQHLRNLALGITAEPLTGAVRWVDRITSFTAQAVVKWSGYPFHSDIISTASIPLDPNQEVTTLGGVLISGSFRRSFDRFIEQAAEPGGKRRLNHLSVEIVLDEKFPGVTVIKRGNDHYLPDQPERPPPHYSAVFLPTEEEMIAAGARERIGAFTRSATIKAFMIYTLADLWRDTLAHRQADRQGSGQAGPETLNTSETSFIQHERVLL